MNKRRASNKLSFAEIIETYKEFRLPRIQRNFKWDLNKCKELFKRIKDSTEPFNYGVLTINPNGNDLVDGQQRLTAILIMLCAFNIENKLVFNLQRFNYNIFECIPDLSEYEHISILNYKIAYNHFSTLFLSEEEKYLFNHNLMNNLNFYVSEISSPILTEFNNINKYKVPFSLFDTIKSKQILSTDDRNSILNYYNDISKLLYTKCKLSTSIFSKVSYDKTLNILDNLYHSDKDEYISKDFVYRYKIMIETLYNTKAGTLLVNYVNVIAHTRNLNFFEVLLDLLLLDKDLTFNNLIELYDEDNYICFKMFLAYSFTGSIVDKEVVEKNFEGVKLECYKISLIEYDRVILDFVQKSNREEKDKCTVSNSIKDNKYRTYNGSNTISISHLLNNTDKIIIPYIQRDYTLGSLKDNLNSFLEFLKNPEGGLSTILAHINNNNIYIYDGQQRLVTIILALHSKGYNCLDKLVFENEITNQYISNIVRHIDSDSLNYSSKSIAKCLVALKNIEIDVDSILKAKVNITLEEELTDIEQLFLDFQEGLKVLDYELFRADFIEFNKCSMSKSINNIDSGFIDKWERNTCVSDSIVRGYEPMPNDLIETERRVCNFIHYMKNSFDRDSSTNSITLQRIGDLDNIIYNCVCSDKIKSTDRNEFYNAGFSYMSFLSDKCKYYWRSYLQRFMNSSSLTQTLTPMAYLLACSLYSSWGHEYYNNLKYLLSVKIPYKVVRSVKISNRELSVDNLYISPFITKEILCDNYSSLSINELRAEDLYRRFTEIVPESHKLFSPNEELKEIQEYINKGPEYPPLDFIVEYLSSELNSDEKEKLSAFINLPNYNKFYLKLYDVNNKYCYSLLNDFINCMKGTSDIDNLDSVRKRFLALLVHNKVNTYFYSEKFLYSGKSVPKKENSIVLNFNVEDFLMAFFIPDIGLQQCIKENSLRELQHLQYVENLKDNLSNFYIHELKKMMTSSGEILATTSQYRKPRLSGDTRHKLIDPSTLHTEYLL